MTYPSERPESSSWTEIPAAPTPSDGEGPDRPAGGTIPPGGGWPPPAGGAIPPGGGWPPPPGGAVPPGWAGPPHPGAPYRRRRRATPAVAALLMAGAAAASAGVGHYLWPASSSSTAQAAGASGSAPASSGASGPSGAQYPSGTSPFGGAYGLSPFSGGEGPGAGTGTSSAASGSPADVSAIAARVTPGLVDVNTNFGYQNASGAGTGIVLTSNGEVLTNNHVINGATSISVTDLGNGRTYSATVVGYDRTADVAVLQLKGASGLRTSKLANSSSVKVGEPVVAIGNAGGVGGRPSTAGGSVTALGQAITASDSLTGTSEQLTGLIQVNSDVQPGDSGGPLVDSAGQVIGMDTAASSGYSLQAAANQGYAIPINTAMTVAHQIEAGRSSATVHVGPTAFLGVTISSNPTGSAGYGYQGYGYQGYNPYGSASGSPYGGPAAGAQVSGVIPGGAAATAGLAGGDVITSLNGQAISGPAALTAGISQDHPGQRIQLGWTDPSGLSHTATVILGSGPPA